MYLDNINLWRIIASKSLSEILYGFFIDVAVTDYKEESQALLY